MSAESSASTRFFDRLPAMTDIRQITDTRHYVDVPLDWYIALTDVQGSTAAIEAGQYKSVNAAGAATIAAMLNAVPDVELPFLFGGDGAAVLVPASAYQAARETLVVTRQLTQEAFGLHLRIGLIPVADVIDAGYQIRVAKLKMSDQFDQPVFTGGGLDYADTLLKADDFYERYPLDVTGDERADFSGYECRWQKHPARYDEVVSLLVRATASTSAQVNQTYDATLAKIAEIYGDQGTRHPIDRPRMFVALNPAQYQNELAYKRPSFTWRDVLLLFFWSIGGYLLWRFGERIWSDYQTVVHATTDREKFDDMLRMTLSGRVQQRDDLTAWLEARYQAGDLIYGIHTSSHTLMTCIVFDRFGRQVHFLDADDGGYAQAARALKQRLRDSDRLTTREIDALIGE